MKKSINSILILLFTFILIVCFPSSVQADEELIIPQWVVDAYLVETGDLHIVEDITFRFNDKFNGVFREIVLDKTSGVSAIQVDEITGTSFKKYIQVEDAKKGDSGVFLIKEKNNKIVIQIFSPSKNEEKTFRITYVVKNVATKYNDTGELYYKFLGDENKTPVDSFTVNIKLPRPDTDNKVKVFAHGPLNGQIKKQNNTTYNLHVTDVPPGTFIEGRILFPKEFIPLSNNVENIDNYSNILEEEAAYQNKLIEDRKRKKAIAKILEQASIAASILGFLLFILCLIAFRRGKDFNHSEEYDGLPEDCTPAVASCLTGTTINVNTVLATILDLCRKGYIKIDKSKEEEKRQRENENFVITQVKEENNLMLNHEKHFMNWLFKEMGNGKSVSTREIETFSEHNSLKFINLYNEWEKKIREDAISKGYFDKSKIKHGVFFLLFSIVLFILGIFTLVYGSLSSIASIVVSAILFVYSIILFYRRSDYGYQQYRKWMHFKKYMEKRDLSNEDITVNYPDIFLIYALSLGAVKRIDKFNFDNADYPDETYPANSWLFWYFIFMNNQNNAFQKSINNSFGGTAGSYSGGGFSGGGGGGAGGGGAGGF